MEFAIDGIGGTDEQELDPKFPRGLNRPRHNFPGRMVAAHRIHGDAQSRLRHASSPPAAQALGFSSRTLTWITCLPA